MPRLPASLLLFGVNWLVASSGCVTTVPRPPEPHAPPPPAEFVVEQSEGAEAARVHAALAPVQRAVSECHSGTGGAIRLRVVSGPEGTRLHVEPSYSLDPRERRCVLEALSTIDVDGVLSDPSPSTRPS